MRANGCRARLGLIADGRTEIARRAMALGLLLGTRAGVSIAVVMEERRR